MNAAPRESGGQDGHAGTVGRGGQAQAPFLDWLRAAGPTSLDLTLLDLVQEPTIYLIPECDTNEDVAEVLRELSEEIFEEQLAGWYADNSTWPPDRSFEVFCRGFDYQHHSMLVDLSDEPLITIKPGASFQTQYRPLTGTI